MALPKQPDAQRLAFDPTTLSALMDADHQAKSSSATYDTPLNQLQKLKRPAARSGMMRAAGLQTSGRPVETVAQDASLPPLGTVGPTLPLQSV